MCLLSVFSACLSCVVKTIACHWDNTRQGFPVPVYGILCHGSSFEFFLLGEKDMPFSILRGCFSGDPQHFQNGLPLYRFCGEPPNNFVRELRQICDVIFDLLLRGYVSSLKGFYEQEKRRSGSNGKQWEPEGEFNKWDEAIQHAEEAQKLFRDAASLWMNVSVLQAEVIAEAARITLKERFDLSQCMHLTAAN
jgi:hypothetical protein